jgi:hypothetical protein
MAKKSFDTHVLFGYTNGQLVSGHLNVPFG